MNDPTTVLNHVIDIGQCDLQALGEDIEELVEYISPAKRKQAVEALVHRLQYIVDDIWNTHENLAIIEQPVKLQLYGSSFTGLDLPVSDIDLTLMHVMSAEKQLHQNHAVPAVRTLWTAEEYSAPATREVWDEWDEHSAGSQDEHASGEVEHDTASEAPLVLNQQLLYERQIAILRQVEREINQRGWAASCQLIRARVPIVKLQERELEFHLDVSVEQLDGVTSSAEIKRALEDNALLAPIIKILKLTLHSHDLHRPYTGGVGSYLLVLLVLHYFKLHGKHVIDTPHESEGESESSTRTHLARALLGVLQWYGETLAPLSWTLHPDTGHVELHARPALVDDIDAEDTSDVTQSVLHPTTKRDVAANATSLPTVFAHWAQLARDLRGGKALDQVVWCRHVIGSYIDKLTRVTPLVGVKRPREESTEDDHVTKVAKIDSKSSGVSTRSSSDFT